MPRFPVAGEVLLASQASIRDWTAVTGTEPLAVGDSAG